MPVKTGPARNAYNARYKRHKEEAGRNDRIKREHIKRQRFGGPVDPNPLTAVRNVVRQVVRFGGSPSHTRRRKK